MGWLLSQSTETFKGTPGTPGVAKPWSPWGASPPAPPQPFPVPCPGQPQLLPACVRVNPSS